jgi:hypothetical protein
MKRLLHKIQNKLIYEWRNRLEPLEEKRIIQKFGDRALLYPPIFIVGAPRTGSTILYQQLTQAFDLFYLNNYMIQRYQTIFAAANKFIDQNGFVKHNQDRSNYGHSSKDVDPNEGSYFWYKWFPYDRHAIQKGELSEQQKKAIYSYINGFSHTFGRPVIFKNLNCGLRLQAFREIFVNILIIHQKRNDLDTAKSIYRGRIQNNGNPEDWFSLMPAQFEAIKGLPASEQIAWQIKLVNQTIESDRELFPDKSYLPINYEDFLANPLKTLSTISDFFDQNGLELAFEKDNLLQISKPTNKKDKLSENIIDNLKRSIEKVDQFDSP